MQHIYMVTQQFLSWKGTESQTCELLIIHLRCLSVVPELKQAGPLKSGILLLVHVLCRRNCSVGIYVHALKPTGPA
jgi:hypothetical protein